MKKLLLPVLAILLWAGAATAQSLEVDKTYEITGKSRRGYLGKVNYDEATGHTELIFVTKSTDKLMKLEHYIFDKDYNYVRMDTEEIEFEKAATKYKWFKYRGEDYSETGISVEKNMVGTLVLKQKTTYYKWSWWWGGYNVTVKLDKKVKPRNEDGGKYFAYLPYENYRTGNTLVLCGAKDKAEKGADAWQHLKKFEMLEVTKDLDVIKKDEFAFDYPMSIVYSGLVMHDGADEDVMLDEQGNPIENLANGDIVLILAPTDMAGKKLSNPDAKAYVYLRLSNEGKVLERIELPSQNGVWFPYEVFRQGNDVYIAGPASADKYFSNVIPGPGDAGEAAAEGAKWEGFQLAKISGGKVAYLSFSNMDDFEAKLQTPPSQKRAPAYKGKRFRYSSFAMMPDGQIFIAGQNFGKNQEGGYTFKDVLLFHFDAQGKLRAQYGARRAENNDLAKSAETEQILIPGTDGQTLYWMLGELDGLREEPELANSAVKVLVYPNVAKINVAGTGIGDFVAFGTDEKGKPRYYLHNQFPILYQKNANKVAFLGANKPGKVLWFGRMAY